MLLEKGFSKPNCEAQGNALNSKRYRPQQKKAKFLETLDGMLRFRLSVEIQHGLDENHRVKVGRQRPDEGLTAVLSMLMGAKSRLLGAVRVLVGVMSGLFGALRVLIGAVSGHFGAGKLLMEVESGQLGTVRVLMGVASGLGQVAVLTLAMVCHG